MEKISVIIPVYNVENDVKRCVTSVLQQTYTNIEVILIDDGSTDQSGVICEAIAKEDSRVSVIHQAHEGPSGSRNVGLDRATGEYIAFIDSDDFVFPNMLEVLYNKLVENSADVSMCEFQRVAETEICNIEEIQKNDTTVIFDKEQLFELLFHNPFKNKSTLIVVWNKLYKRQVFESLRFPKGRIHEDEYLIHHVLDKIKRLVYTDAVYYYYIKHSISIMGVYNESRVWDALYAYEDRAKLFYDRELQNYYAASMKDWLYFAKKSYILCKEKQLENSVEIRARIKEAMHFRLKEMKNNRVIGFPRYIKELAWIQLK